jgi:hypothetical protein
MLVDAYSEELMGKDIVKDAVHMESFIPRSSMKSTFLKVSLLWSESLMRNSYMILILNLRILTLMRLVRVLLLIGGLIILLIDELRSISTTIVLLWILSHRRINLRLAIHKMSLGMISLIPI